jgi:hypothetical protein
MRTSYKAPIDYFLSEGRDNLRDCLTAAFNAAVRHHISKIIIFTAKGVGLRIALEEYCSRSEYEHLKLIGVTFPQGKIFKEKDGKEFTVDIPLEDADLFRRSGVNIVRAHLPFDPISAAFAHHGILGQDVTMIGEALSIFGGSMSLCVQAALMACDAGEVLFGEHAISLTSDTAILARMAPTRQLLRDFVVREIICKPVILTIGKREAPFLPDGDDASIDLGKVAPKALPPGS